MKNYEKTERAKVEKQREILCKINFKIHFRVSDLLTPYPVLLLGCSHIELGGTGWLGTFSGDIRSFQNIHHDTWCLHYSVV